MHRAETLKLKLTSVVAEREYQLVTKGRRRRKVFLRFGKPRRFSEGHGYYCVFAIEGLEDGDRVRRAGGADSVQAFLLAMQISLVELVLTTEYREGRLTWEGQHDLGLLVDDSTRALLSKVRRSARRPPATRRSARSSR